MRQNKNRLFLSLIWMCLALAVTAQPKDNSPFSRFGIGDLADRNFVSSYSMGGLGAVWSDYNQANLVNPASYAYLQSTALEIGFFARRAALQTNTVQSNVWSGNIDYFSLTVPLVNPINELLERRETDFTWGLNLSLTPYSRVGYNIDNNVFIDSIGNVVRNYQGNGGTYTFNVGNGWKYKNFSFGLNLSYLFGKTNYASEIRFSDIFLDYEHVSISAFSYRGFLWNAGLLYDLPLTKNTEKNADKVLSAGLHFSAQKAFRTKGDFLNYVFSDAFLLADTAVFLQDERGEGKLPLEWGFGLLYRDGAKFKIGANFEAAQWANYENDARPETLENSWTVSLGGGYTPNLNSITSFFERVEYRAGFFYTRDPRRISGEQINNYGVTLGAGLPFFVQRKLTYVNFGLEYGFRGTSEVLKENYFRIKMGVSLNDNEWFIKRRYN